MGVPETEDPNQSRLEDSSEQETAYLLKSAAMKQRLLAAKGRDSGFTFESVTEILGI